MKKYFLTLFAPLALTLAACSTTAQNDISTALNAVSATTASIQKSNALPATGTATSVVNDVSTIANALETINTGQGITQTQAQSIAASFKSDSSTTGYIEIAAAISDIVVPFVNGLIQEGKSTSEVQAQTTQLLTALPTAAAS